MLVFLGLVLLQIAFHRTAYLYDSLSELWLYVAYGILTFVAVQMIRADDRVIGRFSSAMAVYGSVYAVFAILQGFTSEGKIYWFITQTGSVYGGYVNHNHYAGLMELLFPIVLVPAFNGSVRGAKRGSAAVCGHADGRVGVFVPIARGHVCDCGGNAVAGHLLDA